MYPNVIQISFPQEQQYARWMAACRMAAKGKSMADRGYDAEVKSIQAFLSMQVYLSYLKLLSSHVWIFDISECFKLNSKHTMYFIQHPVSQPIINPATLDIHVEEYVAPRFLRKMKSKVIPKMQPCQTNKRIYLFDISMTIHTFNVSYFSAEAKDSWSPCKCKRS